VVVNAPQVLLLVGHLCCSTGLPANAWLPASAGLRQVCCLL
jgi:hypothetical protein